jgi:hypothetical protein
MNKLLRLVTGVIQGTKPPCMIVTDLAIYRRLMKIEMRRHTSSGFNQKDDTNPILRCTGSAAHILISVR